MAAEEGWTEDELTADVVFPEERGCTGRVEGEDADVGGGDGEYDGRLVCGGGCELAGEGEAVIDEERCDSGWTDDGGLMIDTDGGENPAVEDFI